MAISLRANVNPDVRDSALFKNASNANYPAGEWWDRMFKTTVAAMEIGKIQTGHPTFSAVGDAVGGAKQVLSIYRGTSMLVKVFSGGLTHEYREVPLKKDVRINGELLKKEGRLNFKREANEEAWATVPDEINGVDIHFTETKLMRRDWMDIVLDVVLMVARFLNPLLWLEKMKVVDLGHHSKWMGTTVGCTFTAVTGIAFLQSLRDLGNGFSEQAEKGVVLSDTDRARMRKKWADVLSNLADVLAIPFDSGWNFSSSKEGALATAICGLASGFIWLAKEAKYH